MDEKQRQINERILLDENTKEAMKALAEPSIKRRTVSLERFVKIFLPVLGQEHDKPIDMNPWMSVAEGPYNLVDVVHDGKVVYTIPALLNRKPIRVNERYSDSMSATAAVAKQKGDAHPNLGQQHLRNGLMGLVGAMQVDVAALAEWNRILKENGYEPVDTSQLPGSAAPLKQKDTASLYSDDVEEL